MMKAKVIFGLLTIAAAVMAVGILLFTETQKTEDIIEDMEAEMRKLCPD